MGKESRVSLPKKPPLKTSKTRSHGWPVRPKGKQLLNPCQNEKWEKSATTPRGGRSGIAKDLRAPLPERGPNRENESISSGMSKCLSCETAQTLCEKPAFSSYCLKEAIEKRWRTFNLEMWKQKTWVVPPSLTGLATSSEGPTKSLRRDEGKPRPLRPKTKLPREGLLRPGLTCPRSRGEEIREKNA